MSCPPGGWRAGRSAGCRRRGAILTGRAMALRLYETFLPSAVIGFGGYPAFPALLAARRDRIPTLIHEQNAVLGRVNRLMAGQVDAIATAYNERRSGCPPRRPAKVASGRQSGARRGAGAARPALSGARPRTASSACSSPAAARARSILSEVVPEGLALLPEHFRRRLQVTQQCRDEDIEQVRARYAALGIPADLATYLPDLPERLAWSHLVIARAGASTIAELTAAGRPAILVPLPSATDDHQTFNAREMARAGGARMIAQAKFTPVELAKQMQKLGLEPGALAKAARAREERPGGPTRRSDLADLVERTGRDPGADPQSRCRAERR